MKEENQKQKSFKKRVIFYILQVILASIFIYQSLEKNVGGFVKEFNPLLFGIGILMIIMNVVFLYMEWKTHKRTSL
ncbi:hypothetical protein HMPREF0072_1373 [Anaerococcus lactolyticus ATCC 51172]|uniref:Uncharacterized protein n=1 Tax=Anaerococcus lactolyticus ATCC 51172 TaxID=525254 RepID=C2BGA3_9FIRM|nr:hypothetical protein [Anaerococcus lactolyticus]EEI86030.1 hypothetical protein HMPREF0072_1373 [Anaerococcus lactolyticus ATCC 51172]